MVIAITALWTSPAFCPGRHVSTSATQGLAPVWGFEPSGLSRRPGTDLSRSVGPLGLRASNDDKGFADLHRILRVQAVGSGRGSFILEMGGIKVLVNPNLEGSSIQPENAHEEFDYVFLSSEEPEFFHRPTVNKMKLTKVKFVTSQKAGQELTKMMVRNLAVLQNGPGGQCHSDSTVLHVEPSYFANWRFPRIRGIFLGVPIIRTIVFWGL